MAMLVWVRQLAQVSRPGATRVGLKLCDQWDRPRRDAIQEMGHGLSLRALACHARKEACLQTLNWIGFYNAERLHEELGHLPPAEYEEFNYKTDTTPTLSAT